MIRAVLKNGSIHPLDPLPAGWSDGQELNVEEAPAPHDGPEDVDRAFQEIAALAAELDDPAEWAKLETALSDADSLAKAQMRREMGLD